jgi:hypothetical protein
MASAWPIPATRILALCGSHTNPRLAPTLQGSTLTSAPLSTSAVASCWRPLARNVRGSIGRCFGSYGKRVVISNLVHRVEQLGEFLRCSSFKLRSLQLIGHSMLQRMNFIPIVNFAGEVADQFELVGCRQQPRRRHDFT